MIQCIKSFV